MSFKLGDRVTFTNAEHDQGYEPFNGMKGMVYSFWGGQYNPDLCYPYWVLIDGVDRPILVSDKELTKE